MVELRNEIFSPDGKLLQTIKKKIPLKAGETQRTALQSKPIANPLLWTPERPTLYKVRTSIIDTKSGKVIDEKTTRLDSAGFLSMERRDSV